MYNGAYTDFNMMVTRWQDHSEDAEVTVLYKQRILRLVRDHNTVIEKLLLKRWQVELLRAFEAFGCWSSMYNAIFYEC